MSATAPLTIQVTEGSISGTDLHSSNLIAENSTLLLDTLTAHKTSLLAGSSLECASQPSMSAAR